MQFEVTLRDSCDLAALRVAGLATDNYFELWSKAFLKNAKLPLSAICSYFLAEKPVNVCLTLLELRSGARIRFEVDDSAIARRIQEKLFFFSAENTKRIPYEA